MTNKISDNWYEDFFSGLNCELWEKAATPEWTKPEVDFLTEELNIKQGEHLLDIPCGFGRHSIELAKRGYQVTGVDISETFIASLDKRIKTEKLSVQTLQADLLSIQLDSKFSGAICLGNSFGYFSFERMKTFVQKVSAVLYTGSRFIIHSGMIAESILPNFSKSESFTVDNLTMDITNFYHVEDSYMVSNILYTKGGKTEEHCFKHYVFTLGEVKRLLKLYDFKMIATYSSPSKEEYHMGDQQIYIVAEKE